MNWKGEHVAIAVLVVALVYYVSKHQSLLSDLSLVPHDNNPPLKAVKDKHASCTAGGGSPDLGAWLRGGIHGCKQ